MPSNSSWRVLGQYRHSLRWKVVATHFQVWLLDIVVDVFYADGGRTGAVGVIRVDSLEVVLAGTHASLAGSLS
jgi:hypothetical protein